MDVSTAKKDATHKMDYKDGISNLMEKALYHCFKILEWESN